MRLTAPALALAALLVAAPAVAQQTREQAEVTQRIAEQKAAMAKLAGYDGVYKGRGRAYPPGGAPVDAIVVHRVGSFLGGQIKMMEGRNYTTEGALRFNGMMVIYYDVPRKAYMVRSFANGASMEMPMHLTPTGYYIDSPVNGGPDYRRINITVTPTSWSELVELHKGDAPPVKMFEMQLARIGESDWPLGRPNVEPDNPVKR